jgi:FlaG/FlaF family flagellin (archaellin)
VPNEDHDFSSEINIQVTGISIPTSQVMIAFLNGSGSVLDSETFDYTTAGVKSESVTLNSPTASTYVGIYITNNTPFDTKNYDVNDFTFDGLAGGGTGTPAIPAQSIAKELCIDVYEVCGFDDGASVEPAGARRLLEDGGFRLLEE